FVAAAATLYPAGLVPRGFEIAVTQSKILHAVAGPTGYYAFLIVSFAVLFSTQLAIIDGMARTISDMIYVNFPRAQKRSLSFWYMFFAGAWIVIGCALAVLEIPPLMLFVTNACFAGLAMAVYCPLTLVINHRFLPQGVKPGLISTLFLTAASLVYISFVVYAIGTVVSG
ncbi:MAG: Nramp family divalent metal transporter, partial [Planctomycetota bacterium]